MHFCQKQKRIKMLTKEIQLAVDKGQMLPLMEEFYTIQGEGFHTGTAAYFIRIGGCDVGCHWCDDKESWNADHVDYQHRWRQLCLYLPRSHGAR